MNTTLIVATGLLLSGGPRPLESGPPSAPLPRAISTPYAGIGAIEVLPDASPGPLPALIDERVTVQGVPVVNRLDEDGVYATWSLLLRQEDGRIVRVYESGGNLALLVEARAAVEAARMARRPVTVDGLLSEEGLVLAERLSVPQVDGAVRTFLTDRDDPKRDAAVEAQAHEVAFHRPFADATPVAILNLDRFDGEIVKVSGVPVANVFKHQNGQGVWNVLVKSGEDAVLGYESGENIDQLNRLAALVDLAVSDGAAISLVGRYDRQNQLIDLTWIGTPDGGRRLTDLGEPLPPPVPADETPDYLAAPLVNRQVEPLVAVPVEPPTYLYADGAYYSPYLEDEYLTPRYIETPVPVVIERDVVIERHSYWVFPEIILIVRPWWDHYRRPVWFTSWRPWSFCPPTYFDWRWHSWTVRRHPAYFNFHLEFSWHRNDRNRGPDRFADARRDGARGPGGRPDGRTGNDRRGGDFRGPADGSRSGDVAQRVAGLTAARRDASTGSDPVRRADARPGPPRADAASRGPAARAPQPTSPLVRSPAQDPAPDRSRGSVFVTDRRTGGETPAGDAVRRLVERPDGRTAITGATPPSSPRVSASTGRTAIVVDGPTRSEPGGAHKPLMGDTPLVSTRIPFGGRGQDDDRVGEAAQQRLIDQYRRTAAERAPDSRTPGRPPAVTISPTPRTEAVPTPERRNALDVPDRDRLVRESQDRLIQPYRTSVNERPTSPLPRATVEPAERRPGTPTLETPTVRAFGDRPTAGAEAAPRRPTIDLAPTGRIEVSNPSPVRRGEPVRSFGDLPTRAEPSRPTVTPSTPPSSAQPTERPTIRSTGSVAAPAAFSRRSEPDPGSSSLRAGGSERGPRPGSDSAGAPTLRDHPAADARPTASSLRDRDGQTADPRFSAPPEKEKGPRRR
jgi:hypothetical protein